MEIEERILKVKEIAKILGIIRLLGVQFTWKFKNEKNTFVYADNWSEA